MSKYHKINTIFKRDLDAPTRIKPLILGEWSCPEFAYLSDNDWVFTEKVDGTNIRIMFGDADSGGAVTFGGKTDNALIPAKLMNRLNDRASGWGPSVGLAPEGLILYGEGYGAGIQKGGGNYRQDQDFVLFDVRAGHWWLKRADVTAVAKVLGLSTVPSIGIGTLHEAVAIARIGFSSAWGEFNAEGIVARPAVELKARSGERIICKIKTRDFAKEVS